MAYAKKFPDGLCGGPLANALKASLILTAAKVETQASGYMKANGIKDGIGYFKLKGGFTSNLRL